MITKIKRTLGRRQSDNPAPDKWPARIKEFGVAAAGIITAIVLGLVNYGSGQRSNDPSIENHQTAQRIEETVRLRAENERLKAQLKPAQK